jgi:hypothetical protein
MVTAINNLAPSSEFSFTDEDYSTIQWDVLEGTAPTAKEVADEIKRLEELQKTEVVAQAEAKAALLDRLGITAEEAQLLLA